MASPFLRLALVTGLLSAALVSPVGAQATGNADTTAVVAQPMPEAAVAQPVLEQRDLIYAAGAGIATLATERLLDRPAAQFMLEHGQESATLRRLSHVVEAIALPGAFIIGGGLYVGGRLGGDDGMADAGLHTTEAVLIGTAVTGVLKMATGRARPYADPDDPHDFELMRGFEGDEYRSFPSGHTVIAFAMAAAATEEVRRSGGSTWLVGAATYGGATLVGLARMYNSQHWASDVAMGAAIGVFTGRRVVKWQHTHPGNRLDRWLLGVSVSTIPNGQRIVRPIILPMR
ncbi:MAG TPA: phosphatase PAP2 family protein [Gemmatimonadaceae bacterium]